MIILKKINTSFLENEDICVGDEVVAAEVMAFAPVVDVELRNCLQEPDVGM